MSGWSDTTLCLSDTESEEETEDDDHFFERFTTEQWDEIDQVEREALQRQQNPNDASDAVASNTVASNAVANTQAVRDELWKYFTEQLKIKDSCNWNIRKRLPRKDDEFHKFLQNIGASKKLAATEWLKFRKRKGHAGKVEIESTIEQLIGEFEEMVDLGKLFKLSVAGTRADIQSNLQDDQDIRSYFLSIVQDDNNALRLLVL